jgi:hypothetical protein
VTTTPLPTGAAELVEEIEAVPATDIGRQWKAKRGKFLAVAYDSKNNLNGNQLFQIWLQFWMEQLSKALADEKAARTKVWSRDNVEYANNMNLFQLGKRDALGPEYQEAADRVDAARSHLSCAVELQNWLETRVDVAHDHLTLVKIEYKALEIAKGQAQFQKWIEPVLFAILGWAASAPRSPSRAPTRDPESIGEKNVPASVTLPAPSVEGTPTQSGTAAPARGTWSGWEPSSSGAQTVSPSFSAGELSAPRPPVWGTPSASSEQRGTTPLSKGIPPSAPPAATPVNSYRAAPGEVIAELPGIASPLSNTTIGRAMEAYLPEILTTRFPQSQFRIRLGKGTPDIEWVGGADPGFDIADLKPASRPPYYDSYYKYRTQVRRWAHDGWADREAPATFRAAMMSYTPNGDVFIEDIGTSGTDYLTPVEALNRPAKPKK